MNNTESSSIVKTLEIIRVFSVCVDLTKWCANVEENRLQEAPLTASSRT
jgi:hypothetical protein